MGGGVSILHWLAIFGGGFWRKPLSDSQSPTMSYVKFLVVCFMICFQSIYEVLCADFCVERTMLKHVFRAANISSVFFLLLLGLEFTLTTNLNWLNIINIISDAWFRNFLRLSSYFWNRSLNCRPLVLSLNIIPIVAWFFGRTSKSSNPLTSGRKNVDGNTTSLSPVLFKSPQEYSPWNGRNRIDQKD